MTFGELKIDQRFIFKNSVSKFPCIKKEDTSQFANYGIYEEEKWQANTLVNRFFCENSRLVEEI